MGLGMVVEYANQRGEPQWSAPPDSAWDYTIFGVDRPVAAPDQRIELFSRKYRAAAAAITAGPSTASPGRIQIRCSRPLAESGIVWSCAIRAATTIQSTCIVIRSRLRRSAKRQPQA